ncbi:class II glutamine amidotransferase [Mycetohabitans rhizoxinica]|uniref:class II glutamine amidotransferase n=1 Tax=Mycetohabitans rhizoxinica TaxID=412963 RepID=UPI0030D02621
MCQLLGMNCAAPTDVTFSFTGFAARGGVTDHHADGFGIAFFEDKACRLARRTANSRFARLCSVNVPVPADVAAKARAPLCKATVASVLNTAEDSEFTIESADDVAAVQA